MEIQEFIQNFSDQFDDTDSVVFTPETNFRELDEWSSLLALSLLAMVDEEYGIRIKGDDIKSSETIKDLYDIVHSRQ